MMILFLSHLVGGNGFKFPFCSRTNWEYDLEELCDADVW